jgi:predicted nucleotidyltransferase
MSAEAIVEKVRRTIETAPSARSLMAYVFGSVAQGRKDWSDIDILIVCHDESDAYVARASMAPLCVRYPIDLLIMTVAEEQEFGFVKKENCLRL